MRFTVYLGAMTAMMMLPSQTTRLSSDITTVGEGEGEGETFATGHSYVDADLEAGAEVGADVEADADAEMQAEVEADARMAALASLEAEGLWADMKDKMKSWGDDIKEGWAKLKENARGLNMTTVSKMMTNKLSGQTAWQSLCHDYTDHVATSANPLNFRDFFGQSTFYHGEGDWFTYEDIQKNRGEEPEMDGYIAQRKDSRNEHVFKMLESLRLQVDKLMSEARVGKEATAYSDYKKSKLPQGFYDKVAEFKDNTNHLSSNGGEAPEAAVEKPKTSKEPKGKKK